MSHFAIVTDTAAELLEELAVKLDIYMISMEFTMGGISYQHHADCRTCKTRREHKETEAYGSERKAVGQYGFRFYLLEYRNLHHTCYGQSRYHAGQCNQCLIGRNIRHLPKVTRGPVVADTLDAALEKKNEAE